MEEYEMTEKEMRKIELATIYELRLIIASGEKDDYTKTELLELLDQLALAKNKNSAPATQSTVR